MEVLIMKKLLLITLAALAVPATNLRAVMWNVREVLEHAQKFNPNATQLQEIQKNLNLVANGLGRVSEEAAQLVINNVLDIDALSPSQEAQRIRQEQQEREKQAKRKALLANMIVATALLIVNNELESLNVTKQMQEEIDRQLAQQLNDKELARQLENEQT